MFGKPPKVPQTISDQQMADLRRRAQKADTESWVSDHSVKRRLASNRQQERADEN